MSGQPALNSNPFFSLDVSNLQVLDPDGTPGDFIVSRAKGCQLQVTLTFAGSLCPIILCCLCWEICYCFDVFCFDSSQPGVSRPDDFSFCSPRYCALTNQFEYSGPATRVTVPANALAVATYKLAAVARFYWNCSCNPPIIRPPVLAGFTDGPVVEVTG
jgi:hypothetical protein